MPKNISNSNPFNGDGIFPQILVNTFAAQINSSSTGFLVYNSVSTNPLFKIDGSGVSPSATFYCDLNVIGAASFTSVSNIAVTSSMMSLATGNSSSDLIDIGFYGLYNSGGNKYRGLVKSISLGRWVLFKDISTVPSSTVTLSGSWQDTLEVQDLYFNGDGSSLSALKASVGGLPSELNNLTNTEILQLENINSNSISSTQWSYISQSNQRTDTAGTPSFSGLTLSTGVASLPAGSFITPTLNFSDTGSGLYRPASNQIGVSTNGTLNTYWTTAGMFLNTGVLTVTAGTAGTPSLNFGSSTTGFYQAASNQIGISISGSNVGTWSSTGLAVNSLAISGVSTLTATTLGGTLSTASQPNITTLAGVTSIGTNYNGLRILGQLSFIGAPFDALTAYSFSASSSFFDLIQINGTLGTSFDVNTMYLMNCIPNVRTGGNDIYGIKLTPFYQYYGNSTTTTSLLIQPSFTFNSGAILTNYYGIYVDATATGTTNNITAYFDHPASGTSSRIAVYAGSLSVGSASQVMTIGESYFSSNVTINSGALILPNGLFGTPSLRFAGSSTIGFNYDSGDVILGNGTTYYAMFNASGISAGSGTTIYAPKFATTGTGLTNAAYLISATSLMTVNVNATTCNVVSSTMRFNLSTGTTTYKQRQFYATFDNNLINSSATMSEMIGFYGDTFTNLTNSGSLTTACSAYFKTQTVATTNNCAVFAENLVIGSAIGTPPTNGAMISGNTLIGTTSNPSSRKLLVNGTIESSTGGFIGTVATASQPSITTMAGLTSLGTSNVVTTIAGKMKFTNVDGNIPAPIDISYSSLALNITGPQYSVSGNRRFAWYTSGLETGSNAGSNMAFGYYNDAGAYVGDVFSITRSTGAMTINNLTMGGTLNLNSNNITNAGIVSATTLSGTLSTAAQTNITSVGTLTGLTVNGNAVVGTTSINANARFQVSNTAKAISAYMTGTNATFATILGQNTIVGLYNDMVYSVPSSIAGTYGSIIAPTFSPSAAQTITVAACMDIAHICGGSGSITIGAGLLIAQGSSAGTSVAQYYGLYVTTPSTGTTCAIATYTQDLNVGVNSTINPPSGGIYCSGPINHATSSQATATQYTCAVSNTNYNGIQVNGSLTENGSSAHSALSALVEYAPTSSTSTRYAGFNSSPTFTSASTRTLSGICTAMYISNNVASNVGTLSTVYGIYVGTGSALGGTVTSHYGGYFNTPTAGTSKFALYANDLAVGGSTVPPTNGIYCSGPFKLNTFNDNTNGNIVASEYTPTIANIGNVTAAGSTAILHHYMRIGDRVIVYGSATYQSSSGAATSFSFSITLPFSQSNFSATSDANGHGVTWEQAAPTNRAQVSVVAVNGTQTLNISTSVFNSAPATTANALFCAFSVEYRVR